MERVLLPPRTRVWSENGWYLYYDPHNFHWVRVNESGRFILSRLELYRTAGDIAEEASERFGLSPGDAEAAVGGFVDELVAAGFLHRNEYAEREQPAFGTREFAYTVYLHLTNNCNLKCPYCYNKSDREYKLQLQKKGRFAPILTTEEYQALIARLVELGVEHLIFTGGEPLMRPDVVELLEFARSLGDDLRLEVLTNGILIKEPMAEALCDFADVVTISLDGHERHLHEHYRGKNTFAPTIRGIRTLVATRERRGRSRPWISVVPALTDRNIGFMKEIFEFALDDLGVDGLAPILFQAGDHQELSLRQIPTLEEWTEAQERTRQWFLNRKPEDGEAAERPAPQPVVPRNQCGVGHGEFSIDPSGFVYPCQTLHFDEFLCGNVRDTDVKEVYESSPVMQRVRGTVVDRLEVCRHCDLKYLCNGGCRSTAYNVYREFDAHNEVYCRHLEKIAVDRMWSNSKLPLHSTESACA